MTDEKQANDDGVRARLRRAVMSEKDQYIVGPSLRPYALAAYGIMVVAVLLSQLSISVYITCVACDVRRDVQTVRDMRVQETLDDEVERHDQVSDDNGRKR